MLNLNFDIESWGKSSPNQPKIPFCFNLNPTSARPSKIVPAPPGLRGHPPRPRQSDPQCFPLGLSMRKWMVCVRENPMIMGWFGGTPILGNPHLDDFNQICFRRKPFNPSMFFPSKLTLSPILETANKSIQLANKPGFGIPRLFKHGNWGKFLSIWMMDGVK